MSENNEPNEFLQVFLEEAVDILSDWERHCLSLQAKNTPETLSALFRAAHNLKGSARSVGLGDFGKFIHKAEDLIVLLRDGRLIPDNTNIRALLDAHSVLSQWRDQLLIDDKYVPHQQIASTEALLIRMAQTEKSDAPIPAAESMPSEAFGFFDEEPAIVLALAPLPAAPAIAASASKAPAARSNESIRIPAGRIDGLMQLIGELSIQQSTILYGLKNNELHEKTYHKAIHMAAKLTRELQLQTMGLRLTDIGRLFQKLERTARDLAVDQGKSIRIDLQGSDVELDKNVIERVSDALVHMVRNAVDHGIESPADRQNKATEAVIRISAFQSAAGVTIMIEDDGHGIDQARVLKKALTLGLTKEGAKLAPSQIYDFMFAPGFSTAAKVTEVSGRGVGLDVVKRTITDLGGTLDITSELGKGTKNLRLFP
ncbi:MAG: hypothetical protein EOP10_21220 [Proteobacteria bacterium]|nr:MAG: hypothetical protein EOP10_21220 [Pseudomonadota bacterium]